MYFTAMSNRYLVIVQAPDCWKQSESTFVINEFLLAGWLRGVSAVGRGIRLTGEVTDAISAQLADALEPMETAPQDELHDGLCGDSGGGMEAFIDFLRGGGFVLVNGETTRRKNCGDPGDENQSAYNILERKPF